MKKHEIIIILSILSMHYNFATTKGVEENDPIDLRIRHLKKERLKHQHKAELRSYDYKELLDQDYVDNSNKPITPIDEYDERKKDERYKQPELKTTTTEKFVASPENSTEAPNPHNTHKKKLAQRQSRKPKAEIFYRRKAFDISKDRDQPQKWTHCLDLLSPYLNGYLNNVTKTRVIYPKDAYIRRLSYLLTINLTDATTDEIKAILYEISTIPMRMYQWDISSVKTILRAVIQDGSHDFKGVKYGVKELFSNWKLNTSNLTKLLTQSRVFRPPCIQINESGGSTVSQKPEKYTKPDQNRDIDGTGDGFTKPGQNMDKDDKCARRDEDC